MGQMFNEDRALLDAKHVANLISCLCQIQDWDPDPILEPRDDAAAEKRDWIVEPRIPLSKNLQRCERSTAFCRHLPALCLSLSFRARSPGTAPLHDLHRGFVFANAARALVSSLILKFLALGADSCGRRWWRRSLARGPQRQLRLFRQREGASFIEGDGPRIRSNCLGACLNARLS